MDIGKIYEDDFLVLNICLKQYGYGNALSLLKDFKDGIFSERFYEPQGALKIDENKDTNGTVSLIDGTPSLEFFSHIDYQKMSLLGFFACYVIGAPLMGLTLIPFLL